MICSKQSKRDWNDVRVSQMLWNGQPRQVGCVEYLVMIECRMLLMLENRRFRKNRILVFQEKRSYTHLNDNGCSEKFHLFQMKLSGKSMEKGKMRNRGKDPSYHKKWAEIGKYVVKVAYFGTFSTNIAP